ncbi:MAG: hypothetical protein KIC92_01845 [Clostridiales bacterium]|nr:hypothetical protein [Clostridiales bacterium]
MGLPIISLFYLKNKNYKSVRNLAILSISLTLISIYFQVLYNNHLVSIGDCEAIEGINGEVIFLCTVPITVTFCLNFINILIMKFSRNK